ncbi:MAG: ParB/RepB/Spo0J family partition protein [Clostridiales Family XIII bacterium]|nr:ParB/RepB/Spo0J family partition protein [Clostridiales Family XIII bacterium]
MAEKKKSLGRGLEALFTGGEMSVPVESERGAHSGDGDWIQYIEIHDIKPNAKQPRKQFNEASIDELASSIEAHGLIQPIIVRNTDGGFDLVAGERRWRAARKAGLKSVPCIVREISDEENLLFALIENMQREDLNPIEEAEAMRQAMESFGLTQEEISQSVGKSRPYIANTLRLLRLDDGVKKLLMEGALSGGHGKALLSVADPKKQLELAEYIVKNRCSVREAEALAEDPRFGQPKKRFKPRPKNHAILSIEEELRGVLGTKVVINNNGDKGKIVLSYYSRDELEGIIELLRSLK